MESHRTWLKLMFILTVEFSVLKWTHGWKTLEDGGNTQRMDLNLSELRKAVEEIELVDGHSHSIVDLHSDSHFIHAFTVGAFADADAIAFSQHALSFKVTSSHHFCFLIILLLVLQTSFLVHRNLRDIAELYELELSLENIEEYRRHFGIQSICSTCFKAARISAMLIDDGLEVDKRQEIEWHKSFVPFVGRIVRIERMAEKILEQDLPPGSSWTLDAFTKAYVSNITVTVAGEVYALKTIAAYYSGLQINTNLTDHEAEEGLREVSNATKPFLLFNNKKLVDYVFLRSLEVALSYDLPVQIHTGFGDKFLDLRLSNPLHLRPLLEDKRYSKCRFVYLDFGLAIPKLSVHGMITSVKELLDLAPSNKVMFSTDGYSFPETFYLGAKNSREVVFSVLRDACIDGDLSIPEAVEVAKDILARNAIRFYNIST
ncbi:hypothetical protein VNO77_16088 [Canavalia gladiata]|uniref:Amidohydrolase-related domain-containing protein n=1 Tax=Canavalia gladiata TaxID=3824 RepID=A0AAN9QRQ3_CANGL